jgi:hypothetical protein
VKFLGYAFYVNYWAMHYWDVALLKRVIHVPQRDVNGEQKALRHSETQIYRGKIPAGLDRHPYTENSYLTDARASARSGSIKEAI